MSTKKFISDRSNNVHTSTESFGTVNRRLAWTASGISWITRVPLPSFSKIFRKGFLNKGRNIHVRGLLTNWRSRLGTLWIFSSTDLGVESLTPLFFWSKLILVPLLLTLEPWKLACLGGSLRSFSTLETTFPGGQGRLAALSLDRPLSFFGGDRCLPTSSSKIFLEVWFPQSEPR